MGNDRATISVTGVEVFEYVPELLHPTRFSLGEVELMLDLINNKIVTRGEFGERTGLPNESSSLRSEEGKSILELTTGARNIQGKPLP